MGVLAGLLDVSERAIQRWVADVSITPRKETLRQLGELFVSHESGINIAMSAKEGDFRGKYIESLERENKRLQHDLDISLGELRHNSLLARAVSETNQELLVELIAGLRKQKYETVALQVRTANGEKYQRMKEEGRFADAGK